MNESHQRHLVATFRHIDELLAEAVANLAPTEEARLYPTCVPDAAPIQRKLIADYARRVRAAMDAGADRFGAVSVPSRVSAVWATRTTLMMAQIAVAELEPERMRGYGPLDADAEREVRALVSELSELLDQMESYLAQGPGDTLDARIHRIENSGIEGASLAELERIVSAHGLVRFRPALERLADRLASRDLEVAVFGRVKSGKSSLLNYILKTSALPVGVTPVSAIPVHIVHGKLPRGEVSFADSAPQIFELGRMAEFASEQQNPSNLRHVTRLVVQIPSPLLEAGIAFVDTPGIGSIKASATAETWAYLPRCDVGIVLVDASSTLTDADVALVDALRHAGGDTMVLLSKADMLEGQDLQRAVSYLAQELAAKLKFEVPVHPVSIRDAALCDRWLQGVLMPGLREHQALATRALGRKLGILRDALRAALVKRLSETPGEADSVKQARLREIDRMLGQALARLDAASRERPAEVERLAGLAREAIDEAAHNAAVIWNQSLDPGSDITVLIESSVQSRAGVAAATVARHLADLRTFLRATLADARGEALASAGLDWEPGHDLPRPAGMPIFDGVSAVPQTVLRRPALAFAGVGMFKHGILGQIEATGLEQRVTDAFAAYGRQLEAWRQSMLNEMRSGFVAQRELVPRPTAPEGGRKTDAAETIVADLQRLDKI